jgi:hypothetical protein
MALTQAQWFDKLKGWVPSWYFETEQYQRAHFMALARLLSDMQASAEALVQETFITQADEYLDLHGEERNTDRLEDEENAAYAFRIQNIVNSSYKAAIKRVVDALLLNGTCEIREGWDGFNLYLSRGSFLSRNEFLNDFHYNVLTILVDPQAHVPYSWLDRGSYASRAAYLGSTDASSSVYASIIKAVDNLKALGVLYKIVERS